MGGCSLSQAGKRGHFMRNPCLDIRATNGAMNWIMHMNTCSGDGICQNKTKPNPSQHTFSGHRSIGPPAKRHLNGVSRVC